MFEPDVIKIESENPEAIQACARYLSNDECTVEHDGKMLSARAWECIPHEVVKEISAQFPDAIRCHYMFAHEGYERKYLVEYCNGDVQDIRIHPIGGESL
jgi:hypothetical protein